ncbi:hypothetical protein [Aeromicrobium endophyticum]|uniref:hypothetical protein n=1 Tax=Aeromicrobium endophyticum TaxID=2292704 RepID=UPI0011C3F270|nr:hypothetical protein [Aeromicrobium endophyticum]
MIRPLLRFAAPLVLLAALAACGGEADVVDQDSSSKADTAKADGKPAKEQGSIVESGFGQGDDQYVWVTALVENKSKKVGQTVTVSFNVKDEAGELLATTDQVESFSSTGQLLALGTQVDVGDGAKAASVEATLLVEDEGAFEGGPSLGTADAEVSDSEFGGQEARFVVKNPTDKPLKDPRIGVICKDSAGKINGGTSEFPELVPPSGEIKVKTNFMTLSGEAKTCTAYIAPGF